MKSLLFGAAVATAGSIAFWGAPAHADPVPEGPVRIYLKDHEGLPLAQEDGAVRLTALHDLWTLRSVEALQDLGEYQIVHDESGQCLSTDTSGGGETAPVFLADCGEADDWTVVYDDVPSNNDFRFISTDGYFLGLEHDADAVEGVRVEAVKPASGASRHFQEWLFAAAPDTPSSPPPSETPSTEVSTSPAEATPAQPQLPTTGAGLGAVLGAGAVALAGGVALVLWWQRRRALRSEW
ncbi:RICIN domain-containing protein [Glycomyces paridis]|uniref:RICIN domain-containing protein n=1 Tax=Glycomyces paridis TaxID=2126555 RepID=UPI0013051CB6|nr:LPXTG cell wall anchor domain-containing protein [Glycomyces paridis]